MVKLESPQALGPVWSFAMLVGQILQSTTVCGPLVAPLEPVPLVCSPSRSDSNVQVNQKALQKQIPSAISVVHVACLFILLPRVSKELVMLI